MFVMWYVNENGERVTHPIDTYYNARWLKKCYKVYNYRQIRLYTENGIRIPLF